MSALAGLSERPRSVRRLHPECTGSQFYSPHSAKVPAAFTLITPGGLVHYFCDLDCLKRTIDREAGIEHDPHDLVLSPKASAR